MRSNLKALETAMETALEEAGLRVDMPLEKVLVYDTEGDELKEQALWAAEELQEQLAVHN